MIYHQIVMYRVIQNKLHFILSYFVYRVIQNKLHFILSYFLQMLQFSQKQSARCGILLLRFSMFLNVHFFLKYYNY